MATMQDDGDEAKPPRKAVRVAKSRCEPPRVVAVRFDPFPNDTRLRSKGFAIADRPSGKPAIWRRGKLRLSENEALLVPDAGGDGEAGSE